MRRSRRRMRREGFAERPRSRTVAVESLCRDSSHAARSARSAPCVGRTVVRGACPHDCPDTCALLVTVENGRAIEVRGAPTIRRPRGVAVHEGRALSRAHVFGPARAASDAARRPQGRRPLRAHLAGTRRSTTIAARFARDRRVARRPAGDRPLLATPARWASCSTARWTAASSTGSARRCSTARSARPPARPAGPRSIGAAIGTDVEQFDEQPADPDLGQQPDRRRTCTSGRARRRRSAAARSCRDRSRTAARPPRSATSTSRCCRAPTRALALGMMHVLIAEDLLDHDYIDALHGRLRRARGARGASGRRSASRRICGIARRAGRRTSRATTARRKPAAIRLNYGMQRARRRRQRGARDRLPAGARRRVARSRRRRAAVVVGHLSGRHRGARAARPHPRHAAHDQHERDRRRAARRRAIRRSARSTSTTRIPVAVAPESAKVRGGLRARGSLLRRARDLPDRHRRLRRHPAAGDDAARADRRPQLLRPPVRARQQSGDRAARRGEAEHRGVPAARRAHGLRRALLPRQRRRPRAAGVTPRRIRARRASTGTR